MAPKIYKSPHPSVTFRNTSILTHLISSAGPDSVGNFPASDAAYVDAPSGITLTRGQVKRLAFQLAHSLRNHSSVRGRRGDTALIYSPNSLSWPIALFGSVAAGLKITFANCAYNARELSHQYKDSGAKIIYTSEAGISVVLEVFKNLGFTERDTKKRIVVMTNSLHWAGGEYTQVAAQAEGFVTLSDLLGRGSVVEEEKFDGELATETVYMCYSSGTTGKPKGVETTHRNMISVLELNRAVWPYAPSGPDRYLHFLPFYHCFGAFLALHLPFICGFPLYIMPRFDPEQFVLNIEKYSITSALVVPPVLVTLKRHPSVDKYNISSLEVMLCAAAPLGLELLKAAKDRIQGLRMDKKELTIVQGYGLTEVSTTCHILPAADDIRKAGSVGLLIPNLEARLVLDGEGEGKFDAEEGQPGELWVRGPSVMKQYHNNVAATKECFTHDGWFKTGDIATRDSEGYYYIVDRRKELIKYKGSQVPPAELESVLLSHPDIADAAVIGVESAREATELPRAYVVPALAERLKSEKQKAVFALDVQQWITTKVAKHMFLRGGVVVVEAIPKSAAGKILRRELRERAKEELAGRDPADGIIQAKL